MSELRAGRPQAARTVWNWREPVVRPDVAAAARGARIQGVVRGVLGAMLGGVLLLLGFRFPAAAVLTVAAVVFLAALLSPGGAYPAIQRGFLFLGQRTGQALTWALLTPLFYLGFAPFGQLLRRGRRDRLRPLLEPGAPSYWEPHEGLTASSSSYRRPY